MSPTSFAELESVIQDIPQVSPGILLLMIYNEELFIKLLDVLDDKTISEKIGIDIEKIKELRKMNS